MPDTATLAALDAAGTHLDEAGRAVVRRNNVVVTGNPAGRPLVLAHGFGCDQGMWRLLVPFFAPDHLVVLLDHVGAGGSDASAYDRARYDSLDGYADDLAEVLEVLDLRDAVLVGHSVSAMISVIAASLAAERVSSLVLIGPSPRYVDDDEYVGGFSRADIEGMLLTVSGNFTGWAQAMAPVIMGSPERPELGQELTATFCRTDPRIAGHFAEVTFLSDNRRDLATVSVPTLVVQCSEDPIAPAAVGEYVHRAIPGSRLAVLDVHGHCPHLSHPTQTAAVLAQFLAAG